MEGAATPVVVNNSSSSKTKTTLILVVVVLVIGIVIAVYFYLQGKKKSTTDLNISSPLTSSGTNPTASEAEIRQIAEQLHDDMNGLNWSGHDTTTWNNFMALDDGDIVKVNNQFNAEYQSDSGYSFVEWVSDESGSLPTQALQRLKKLNLS